MTARVLHIAESYGAGTAGAISAYVRSTPDLEHHLMYRGRESEPLSGHEPIFTSRHQLGDGISRNVRAIRRVTKDLRPDVVHAHSSWAGVLTRLSILRLRSRRIVYTPHCFAFERRDIGSIKRFVIRLCEAILSLNTTVIAACSQREGELARGLRRPAPRAIHVPNVAIGSSAQTARSPDHIAGVFTVGRVSAQKDPEFFAAFVQELRRLHPSLAATWVGGGDPSLEKSLRDAGISVTGWSDASTVQGWLASGQVYVHTAAWDGFPLTILEANAAGARIVARTTPALGRMPDTDTRKLPAELADVVNNLLASPSMSLANRVAWTKALADNTGSKQRDRLLAAYCGVSPERAHNSAARASGDPISTKSRKAPPL